MQLVVAHRAHVALVVLVEVVQHNVDIDGRREVLCDLEVYSGAERQLNTLDTCSMLLCVLMHRQKQSK